jgi:hypothetical protein
MTMDTYTHERTADDHPNPDVDTPLVGPGMQPVRELTDDEIDEVLYGVEEELDAEEAEDLLAAAIRSTAPGHRLLGITDVGGKLIAAYEDGTIWVRQKNHQTGAMEWENIPTPRGPNQAHPANLRRTLDLAR